MGPQKDLGPSGFRDIPDITVAAGSAASSVLVHHDGGHAVLGVPVAPAAAGERDIQPREGTADVAARYGIDLAELAARTSFAAGAGQRCPLELPRVHGADAPWQGLIPSVALIGIGSGDLDALRAAGAALAAEGRQRSREGEPARVVTTVASGMGSEAQRALLDGYLLASYARPQWTAQPATPPAPALQLLGSYDPAVVEQSRAVARVVWLARDLAAIPAHLTSSVGPMQLLAGWDLPADVDIRVLDAAEVRSAGMGGLAAIGAASQAGPSLVVVEYRPRAAGEHIALVGAGLTYDTGGLALKKREAMALTSADVSGAAVALAATMAAASLHLPTAVTAVLPWVENSADGGSWRPGDVIRTCDGTSVELRPGGPASMVMVADALAYTLAHLRPDAVLDIATVGEASAVGLGRQLAALYTTSPDLQRGLTASGTAVGEPLWAMPLVDDYAGALASPLADIATASNDPHLTARSALAALFLRAFAQPATPQRALARAAVPWAHLDISAVALAAQQTPLCPQGPTGWGVRTVVRWLSGLAR